MTQFNFKPFQTVVKTGQTTVYVTGDDGTYQTGRVIGTRFVDNGDNTITDLHTGLMWISDHDTMGSPWNATMYWNDAVDNCAGLSYAGHTDWRLPNVKELFSLIISSTHSPAINSTFFPNTKSENYHTSTTYPTSTAYKIAINFREGITAGYAVSIAKRVRPVRLGTAFQTISGTTHNFGTVNPIDPTYQTTSYRDYDDGYYEMGSSETPRIVDNGNGTATDRLTGLMWIKNPSSTLYTWANAIGYCHNLSYAGYTDWRSPTIHEAMSLYNFGKSSAPVLIGTGILTPRAGSISGRCNLATTNPQSTTRGFVFYTSYTSVQSLAKTSGTSYTWPVRGGKQ